MSREIDMVNVALGFKWAERRRDPAYKPDL